MGINQGGVFDDTNESYVSRKITVGNTQVKAVANVDGITNLEGRQEVFIYNASSNKTIWYGPNGVIDDSPGGVAQGIPLEPGETLNISLTDKVDLYLICDSSNNDVIIQELG